jgi:hypothetical protein
MADMSAEFEGDEVDLVDTDALSRLMMCVEDEEMTSAEARAHLEAWARARPGAEAAAELAEAMLDDDDPELWALGLEAMGRLDPAVAVPVVSHLRSPAQLGPLAAACLRGHGGPARPPRPR